MPRYLVCLWDGQRSVNSIETDLCDGGAAELYASRLADNLRMIRKGLSGGDWAQWVVRVTDEGGREVFRTPVEEQPCAGRRTATR